MVSTMMFLFLANVCIFQLGSAMPRRYVQTKDFERGRIIGMLEAGLSLRDVARRTGRSLCTVQRWWNRYNNVGTCERQAGSGRPRVSDARDDRYLTTFVRRNRFSCARRYRDAWRNACNVQCSIRTVYGRLIAAKLRARRPLIRIPLGPVHRRNRLQWATDHLNWNNRRWNNVLFSNESRFCLDFNDGRVLVRRLPSERFLDACIREHDRYGGGSVMVWAGVSATRRTDLVSIQGTLTGQRYVNEVLRPHVLPLSMAVGRNFLFQQDNARPHIARVARDCLHEGNVNVLDWPSRSPDLSPIEHLWDILGRRVRDSYQFPAATLEELQHRLLEQWQRIPQRDIRHLIMSMRRRLQECVRKRGGHTRY